MLLRESSSHFSGLLESQVLGHELGVLVLGSESSLLGLVVDGEDSGDVLSDHSHSAALGLRVTVGVFDATQLWEGQSHPRRRTGKKGVSK